MGEGEWAVTSVLAGVVVGFALDYAATWRRDRKTEKTENESVRLLLALQMEQTLERLRDFWNRVLNSDNARLGDPPREKAMAYALANETWPGWTRSAWDAQIGAVPRAFKPEKLRQVHHSYRQLDVLAAIYASLAAMAAAVTAAPQLSQAEAREKYQIPPISRRRSVFHIGPTASCPCSRAPPKTCSRGAIRSEVSSSASLRRIPVSAGLPDGRSGRSRGAAVGEETLPRAV